MTRANPAAIAVCVATAAIPVPAAAQSASAELLFREGRELIKQGKLVAGCDKLAASDRVESSVGTLLNLGDCREKLGQLATAWALFRRAEAIAHRSADDARREAEARRRADRLEDRLPRLEIDVPHPADGMEVRRDDEVVDAATFGAALPIDPGAHTIVATATGRVPWKRTLRIDGPHAQLTVPALDRVPSAPVLAVEPVVAVPEPVPAPAPPHAPPPVVIERRAPAPSRWTVVRGLSVGIALGGVGALATGAYIGLRSHDLRDRADTLCPAEACGDPHALALNAEARTDATRANVLYAAGGTAALASLVLWFAGAPGDSPVITPSIGDRRAGLSFARRF
jgi:serine/threonine-protein kinase